MTMNFSMPAQQASLCYVHATCTCIHFSALLSSFVWLYTSRQRVNVSSRQRVLTCLDIKTTCSLLPAFSQSSAVSQTVFMHIWVTCLFLFSHPCKHNNNSNNNKTCFSLMSQQLRETWTIWKPSQLTLQAAPKIQLLSKQNKDRIFSQTPSGSRAESIFSITKRDLTKDGVNYLGVPLVPIKSLLTSLLHGKVLSWSNKTDYSGRKGWVCIASCDYCSHYPW